MGTRLSTQLPKSSRARRWRTRSATFPGPQVSRAPLGGLQAAHAMQASMCRTERLQVLLASLHTPQQASAAVAVPLRSALRCAVTQAASAALWGHLRTARCTAQPLLSSGQHAEALSKSAAGFAAPALPPGKPLHAPIGTAVSLPTSTRERSRNAKEGGDKAAYAAAQVSSRTSMQDQERHIPQQKPAGQHLCCTWPHCILRACKAQMSCLQQPGGRSGGLELSFWLLL